MTKKNISLVPWFINRMTDDVWGFAILTTHGLILIHNIDRVASIGEDTFIDVECFGSDEIEKASMYTKKMGLEALKLPSSRTSMSINIKHIVAAFEIYDT